jgi:hypothetical protein
VCQLFGFREVAESVGRLTHGQRRQCGEFEDVDGVGVSVLLSAAAGIVLERLLRRRDRSPNDA